MTIEEYLAQIVTQLQTMNASLVDLQAAITGSIGQIATSMDNGRVLFLEVAVLAGLVALAYWRNVTGLYVVALVALILIGWQWDIRLLVPLLLLALYTGYRALRPYLPW
jgi:hypothetical protein